ncbi:MAG: FAD:protein FMN transferase, partial [Thermoanaerobaculia bacterium]
MSGIVSLLVAAAVAASGPVTLERRLVLMGTEASVRVTAESREAALAGAEAAVRSLERTEERLSTWTEESELARLNRSSAGEPVELSPELAGELAAALACSRATEGAFDPTVGSLVDAWELREGGRVPGSAELEAARRAAGADGLDLVGGEAGAGAEAPGSDAGEAGPERSGRAGAAAVRRIPGLRIEEGGFGKGAALDAARAALEETPGVASAVLDLGGQVAVYEPREVAEPAAREEASSSPTRDPDALTPSRVGAELASARGTAAGARV